ncbi:MAG: phospho-sugar mutase [Sphaerochaetaceae bacterium]|nr:phospho-sugar mutase [Sphaerochaetaceae bacterium]
MNDNEHKEIYRKAEEYIAHEKSAPFRQEVMLSYDEHADDDLYDRFYTALAFGTAGMRGVIGGGSNRMNPFMVRKVSQGLAEYLLTQEEKPSVTIAFDSRNYSNLFAQAAALTLCANNVKVYLYDTLQPVPVLSFAVQHLNTTAGIVITASHNPARYNGYKVYYRDGGQVTPPHDIGIAEKVNGLDINRIREISEQEARNKGLLLPVPAEVDDAYDAMVLSSVLRKDVIRQQKVSVAYTPLHGAGNIPVRRMLERLSIQCHVVDEQVQPDGDFPTVSMPNPEDPEAMRLVLKKAKDVGADIVLGTDPDSDRLGIAIPSSPDKSEYTLLSGNQIAVLLTDYLIERYNDLRFTDKRPLVVKSFVTTDLVRAITEAHGGRCKDVLTGFKYIAEQIVDVDSSSSEFYLFGCEESFGYNALKGVRDKDAVSSAVLAVEMMSYYASVGKTLQDRLNEIYQLYGFYTEKVLSFSYEGARGKEKMKQIMESFRSRRRGEVFADLTIESTLDLAGGDQTDFPRSDVVILTFTEGTKMVIRPSGTEPKIKYYFFFKTDSKDFSRYLASLDEKIASIKAYL